MVSKPFIHNVNLRLFTCYNQLTDCKVQLTSPQPNSRLYITGLEESTQYLLSSLWMNKCTSIAEQHNSAADIMKVDSTQHQGQLPGFSIMQHSRMIHIPFPSSYLGFIESATTFVCFLYYCSSSVISYQLASKAFGSNKKKSLTLKSRMVTSPMSADFNTHTNKGLFLTGCWWLLFLAQKVK